MIPTGSLQHHVDLCEYLNMPSPVNEQVFSGMRSCRPCVTDNSMPPCQCTCCQNHESCVAYPYLEDSLLYPDLRLYVESGDHKEGFITHGSACSSTIEAFFLVVDRVRSWLRCFWNTAVLFSGAYIPLLTKCLAISQTCFFSGQQFCG